MDFFYACDAEHMLCMIYSMHQCTLPSRNLGWLVKMDSDRYFPIRYTVGTCLAKDLPFTSRFKERYYEKLEAYQRLLKDESYPNHQLDDIFRIDFGLKYSY